MFGKELGGQGGHKLISEGESHIRPACNVFILYVPLLSPLHLPPFYLFSILSFDHKRIIYHVEFL